MEVLQDWEDRVGASESLLEVVAPRTVCVPGFEIMLRCVVVTDIDSRWEVVSTLVVVVFCMTGTLVLAPFMLTDKVTAGPGEKSCFVADGVVCGPLEALCALDESLGEIIGALGAADDVLWGMVVVATMLEPEGSKAVVVVAEYIVEYTSDIVGSMSVMEDDGLADNREVWNDKV